jgi:hypothetical protein
MKFVNKLSVLSLVVLMFSFMNVANAKNICAGNHSVKSCDEVNKMNVTNDEKASRCNNTYPESSTRTTNQCKWTKVLVVKIHNHDNSTAEAEAEWTCNDSGSKCEY